MSLPRTPIKERLARLSVPEPNTGCHLWIGAVVKNGMGYGYMGRGGHDAGTMLAHRAAWELANGPIPTGMCVCHRCDTPSCVNPDHLFLGTTRDNLRDMAAKGRARNANSEKTHCKRGHEFTPENTIPVAKGRSCRECMRWRKRKVLFAPEPMP